MNNPLMFHGYKVIANPIITESKEREVRRTWKERLFTLPWRPFKALRTETYQVPSRDVMVDKINRIIYAHPVVVKEMNDALNKVVGVNN